MNALPQWVLRWKNQAAKPRCKGNTSSRRKAATSQANEMSGFTSAMTRQRNGTTSQARLPGIGEDVKKTFGFE